MGVPRMTILCLCREEHDWKLIPGYADALRRRGIELFCGSGSISLDATLYEVLRTRPDPPSASFHFESAHPLFPTGLEKSQIPTIPFSPDTYAFTPRRIRWSAVFDHAAVFHPGYVEQFAAAGHPAAFRPHHAAWSPSILIPPTHSQPAPHANSAVLLDKVFARQ